jgi:hypothetical protein
MSSSPTINDPTSDLEREEGQDDRDKLTTDALKLELDRQKLKLDHDKAVFDQNFAQFRNLNDHLHRLPALSTTLTGGLWFAAGIQKDLPIEIKFGLLYLAGWFSLILVLVMFRLRDVMESYLEKIKQFAGDGFATGEPTSPSFPGMPQSYDMVRLFALMGLIAGVLSWVGCFYFFWSWSDCLRYGFLAATAVLLLAMFAFTRRSKTRDASPRL